MTCTVLLINGSLRGGSVNAAVLRTARELAPTPVAARLYGSMAELPHFNPDHDRDPLDPVVADLRAAVGRADALLFCTPEYAGALPGAFKNLLDWLVGGQEMGAKPAAWINAASPAAPAGGEDACASLRKVLGYLGARIVEPACLRIPMSRADVDADGIVREPAVRARVAAALAALADAAVARDAP